LPIKPQNEVLWRPTFDVNVEGELLGFIGKLIRHAIAIDIDLEASRRFADRKRTFIKKNGMICDVTPVEGRLLGSRSTAYGLRGEN
jgi:hypothetical protein